MSVKISNRTKNLALFAVFIILCLFVDIYFANKVYRTYEPLVDGFLGMTFLFLLFRTYVIVLKQKTIEKPLQSMITYPFGIKHLIFGLFWSIVAFWIFLQIGDMVFYLIKPFTNG